MSTTIRIMQSVTTFKEKEVNGKKHTQAVTTLSEAVAVPFGVKIDEFTDELEKECRDYYINYCDGGFRGEIEGIMLLELVKKYNLIVLEEICDDDCYEVVVGW